MFGVNFQFKLSNFASPAQQTPGELHGPETVKTLSIKAKYHRCVCRLHAPSVHPLPGAGGWLPPPGASAIDVVL